MKKYRHPEEMKLLEMASRVIETLGRGLTGRAACQYERLLRPIKSKPITVPVRDDDDGQDYEYLNPGGEL